MTPFSSPTIRRFRRRAHPQRGAVLVYVALMLPVFLGFAAVVMDLSAMWENRRLLQNCADAAALAAAHDLPNEMLAEMSANDYLYTFDDGACLRDGVDPKPEIIIEARDNPSGVPNAVTVNLRRNVAFGLAPAIGSLLNADVPATATAIKGEVEVLKGLQPFSLLVCDGPDPGRDCPGTGMDCETTDVRNTYLRDWDPVADTYTTKRFAFNEVFTIKVGSGDPSGNGGNFQLLEVGDPNTYRNDVKWGSDRWLDDCSWVMTYTGNRVGPTTQGLLTHSDSRIARDIPHSSTPYEDVMLNADGNHGGHGPTDGHMWECPRIMFVAFTANPLKGGGKTVIQILTFAVMFIEDYVTAPGNQAWVKARFYNPEHRLLPPDDWDAIGGLTPDGWKPTGVRLVE